MPVQIIVQKALSEEENLWLASLRNNLKKEMLDRLVAQSGQRSDLGAYIYVVLAANEKTLKGEIEMASFMKTLSEKPDFAEEIAKLGFGNLAESAKKLLKSGVSADIVADSLGLSLARVEEIKAELEKEALAQTQDA